MNILRPDAHRVALRVSGQTLGTADFGLAV